jgi:hypothetical protein
LAVAGRDVAKDAQAALVESSGAGIGNIEDAAPRSQRYRRQFGADARPTANPAANYEAGAISRDIAALANAPTPEVLRAADLDSRAAYLFRTDPGYRMSPIRLPGVPQCRNEKHQEYHERQYKKKYTPDEIAHHDLLQTLAGGLYLVPMVVARKQECYWEFNETDEYGRSLLPLVEHMRALMAAGKLPHVYEDVPRHKVEKTTLPSHREQAAMRMRIAKDLPKGYIDPAANPVEGYAYDPAIDEFVKEPEKPTRRRTPRPPRPRDPKTGRLLSKEAAAALAAAEG